MFEVELFKGNSKLKKSISTHLLDNPQRMILLSFLLVIAIGTSLLSIPSATKAEGSLNFIDALFTATSATCVTGLVVVATGETFTLFGQWVILLMIQLGGLGIMSFSTFFVFLFIGKFSISGREVLIDTFSQNPMAELGKLIRVVFTFTIILETAGTLLFTLSFLQDGFPFDKAIYYGLFHSISSFCNAGFTILPNGFLEYTTNWYFNSISMVLILAGGLGFIVIYDLYTQLKFNKKGLARRLSLHSKLVLSISIILLLAGVIAFFILESDKVLTGYSWHEKFLIALFQSVTARTAGFNTVTFNELSAPTLFFFIVLMFIGASPGSCGGGIKTTTFALFVNNIFRNLSTKKDINFFYRRIPEDVLSRATSIVYFSIFTIGFFVFLLLISEIYLTSKTESELTLMNILFEVVSAFGTVGLSTGVTNTLTPFGKILITILMYVGRLGPLTLIFAVQLKEKTDLRYMKENIMVG